jgi:hypothetical protein
MNAFKFFCPVDVVFSLDAQKRAGEKVKAYGGKRVLVIYGKESAKKSGLLDEVVDNLKAAGLEADTFGGIGPNPILSRVLEGKEKALEFGADFLLALGGGSVIDAAKAIAYAVKNEDVWALYERKAEADDALPLGCIVTIAAAGSETGHSSVLTNDSTHAKRSYSSDLGFCKFALMNPALTCTLPVYQTMCGCSDIIMHTLERWVPKGEHLDLTDAFAAGLLKTVIKHTRILKDDPTNLESRAEIMWAGSQSHNGLTGLGAIGHDFATHGLGHEITGFYNVAHGATLTAIWPWWAKYVLDEDQLRFEKLAKDVFGLEGEGRALAEAGIEAMTSFFQEIGMPVNLKEAGLDLSDEDLKALAASCIEASPKGKGTAKLLLEPDMLAIYRMANEGKTKVF